MNPRNKPAAPIGKTFGYLTCIAEAESRRDPSYVLIRYVKVRCFCGKEKEIRLAYLNYGSSRSCGCMTKELAKLKKEDPLPPCVEVFNFVIPPPFIEKEPKLNYKYLVKEANVGLIEFGLTNGLLDMKWISRMNQLTREFLNPKR